MPEPTSPAPLRHEARLRVLAATVSLVGGAVILSAKMIAWRLTGSHAVLSDALESIVNVLAAAFALNAIRFAARPADREHPYGHGKMEFLSAAFEGGLIAFAAAAIVYDAGRALWFGAEVRSLDLGLAVTAGAGLANLALGTFVLRMGRRLHSPTLCADGLHILSDVWTTAGVLLGLGLVRLTGIAALDPLAALGVGLSLARTGVKLVRGAARELLDTEDPGLAAKLVEVLNRLHLPGFVGLHRLRVLRHGEAIHIDGHIHVAEHWTVRQAHDEARKLEELLRQQTGLQAELALHLDPCRSEPCPACALESCALRRLPFGGNRPLTLEEAVGPPRPPE